MQYAPPCQRVATQSVSYRHWVLVSWSRRGEETPLTWATGLSFVNRVVIEFELQDDNLNPARTESKEPFNDEDRTGLSGLPYEPTEDDLLESTINAAKPIRTSRARRRAQPSNDYKGADIFQTLGQITDQLSKAEDLPQFLKITVGIMQDLTNYHRVMIYQFDEQWNGQVVAELVDWSKTRDLYRGLHFPAADIPAQARELYRVNRVRLLYDRDQPTARMVCRNHEELESPLDMTHCALRAMSPIHIKYLGACRRNTLNPVASLFQSS